MKGLGGKRVLVTGGATGIGMASVYRLAEEGCSVAVNYIGESAAADAMVAELAERHPQATFTALHADVADEAAVEDMIAKTVSALGGLDVMVGNAGIKALGEAHEIDMNDFDRVMSINLRGAFLCAQAAIRHFLAEDKPGVVVTTSSIHQVVPMPEATAYMISKSGIAGLTKSLALSYAGKGIRVVAVGPGAIMTPMNHDLASSREAAAAVEAAIPMGRIAEPSEIASVIAFLASDEASYITGQTIFADGGLMIGRP